jgi:hypothetical protein
MESGYPLQIALFQVLERKNPSAADLAAAAEGFYAEHLANLLIAVSLPAF